MSYRRGPQTDAEHERVRVLEKQIQRDFLAQLLDIAEERQLTTAKAKKSMSDNILKGRFSTEHYIDLWLPRLGGVDDKTVGPIVLDYYSEMEDAAIIKEEIENPDEDEADLPVDNLDYASIIGKTIRTAEDFKLKITEELWEKLLLLQSSWRKFSKRTKSKRASRLTSVELRDLIDEMDSVIPEDNVPALASFTHRGSFGADARAARDTAALF